MMEKCVKMQNRRKVLFRTYILCWAFYFYHKNWAFDDVVHCYDVTTFVLEPNADKWLERARHETFFPLNLVALLKSYIYTLGQQLQGNDFWDNAHDHLFVLIAGRNFEAQWRVQTHTHLHVHTYIRTHNHCTQNYVQRLRQSQYHPRIILCKQNVKRSANAWEKLPCDGLKWNIEKRTFRVKWKRVIIAALMVTSRNRILLICS